MKTKSLFKLSTTIALLAVPLYSGAASFTGKLVGHHCAHEGTVCPVDKLDPHITLERDFVLVAKNKEYYFLPNLPRDVKVRHVLEDVTINGEQAEKYNSITVSELKIEGSEKPAWSAVLQKQVEDIFEYYDAD